MYNKPWLESLIFMMTNGKYGRERKRYEERDEEGGLFVDLVGWLDNKVT